MARFPLPPLGQTYWRQAGTEAATLPAMSARGSVRQREEVSERREWRRASLQRLRPTCGAGAEGEGFLRTRLIGRIACVSDRSLGSRTGRVHGGRMEERPAVLSKESKVGSWARRDHPRFGAIGMLIVTTKGPMLETHKPSFFLGHRPVTLLRREH